ncbi:MAG: hypothetical protein HQK96_09960 [Nitrospirae bacterium]|nr:hypothetical protein [Nitrospirota bacterium]
MKQPFKGRFLTSRNDRKGQGWQQTKQLPLTYDGEQIYRVCDLTGMSFRSFFSIIILKIVNALFSLYQIISRRLIFGIALLLKWKGQQVGSDFPEMY